MRYLLDTYIAEQLILLTDDPKMRAYAGEKLLVMS